MICIAWVGMPSYAACAAARFAADTAESVVLIGTASDVPKTCTEKIDGVKIHWVALEEERTLHEILGQLPRVLVVSGWFLRAFVRFVDEMKMNMRKTIVMCDNRNLPFFKRLLWAGRFRLMLARRFDAFMVPGLSGQKLLQSAGVASDKIATGMYTANPEIFYDGLPLTQRKKQMIYVGRFDTRKNVIMMLRAFIRFSQNHSDWTLDCYGQGTLQVSMQDLLAQHGCMQVRLHPFLQPNELALRYRAARVGILASVEDHWGVVVHEAALSGCVSILSDNVGAAEDFLESSGCLVFENNNEEALLSCFETVAQWTEEQWEQAHRNQLSVAMRFSPRKFSENLTNLIARIQE